MSRSTNEVGLAHGLVVLGWVLAGVLLLATASVRWVERGPGSRFGGLELADNLRRGVLSPSWGVWVALSFYSIVAVGGLLIASAGFSNRRLVIVRGALCATLLAAFVALGWVVLPIDNWAAGPTMATTALVISAMLTAVQLFTSSRI